MAYRLVDTSSGLEEALDILEDDLEKQSTQRLYLDTEFESNRSGTSLCLLQVSAGGDTFLIDPLRQKSLDGLADLLADESIEWVMHAGLQDVELITRDFRISAPKRLFDTQIAWGLLSPESSVSLAYLQFKLLGLRSEKGHQADDWVRRPLQASQLRYAASDVDHLPQMTNLLLQKAEERRRTEIVYAASKDTLNPLREPPAPLSLSSFRNAWQLSPQSQAALRYLMEWYNGLSAKERQRAPEPKSLLSIAGRCPEDVGALGRIKGVPAGVVRDHGQTLVLGIKRALSEAQSGDFVPLDPPPYATFEEVALDAWLAQYRASLSIELGFAPELVLPGRLMKRIQSGIFQLGKEGLFESLVGWRRDLLLEKSVQFCDRSPLPV